MSTQSIDQAVTGGPRLPIGQRAVTPGAWIGRLGIRAWGPTIVVVIVLAAIWETLSAIDSPFWPAIVLSRPSDIAPSLYQAMSTGLVWQEFGVTLHETVVGFAIAAVVGFLLGAGIGVSALFRRATYPILILFQSMPRIALAPVFIAWFGFGINSKIALAVTLAFFPIMINTITGLAMVDKNAVLLMRSMKASRMQIFRLLQLPGAIPTVMAGLKTGLTFALIGAIVGELAAANAGVGHLIETASFQLRMDDVFAYLILLSFMGLALFAAMDVLERRLAFWNRDQD